MGRCASNPVPYTAASAGCWTKVCSRNSPSVLFRGDDDRRRYYGVTKLDRQVARAEATRMRSLLNAAEGAGVLEGK